MQHEIDHLHGRLFIDHLSFLKRRKALKAWDDEKAKYPNLIRTLDQAAPADAAGTTRTPRGDAAETL
jgi:hypothetical protein